MARVKTNFGGKIYENGKFYNLIFGGNVHLKRPNLKKVLWEYMWSNFGQVLWTEIFSKLKTIKTNLAFGKVEEMRSKNTD